MKTSRVMRSVRRKKHSSNDRVFFKKEAAGESSSFETSSTSLFFPGYVNNLNNKGQFLPRQEQQFFGPRMNHDFSDVKIHTDKKAAQTASNINAQAYTYGNHIVFNENKYHPESSDGKKLLAHELTHVMQQTEIVQRSPDDKHDLTSAKLSGEPLLEKTFDNEWVVMKHQNGAHVQKIQESLIQLDIKLPKFGADKDFGTETADGVKEFQLKAGMSDKEQDGKVGRKTIGLLDMSLRNNSIAKDEDTGTTDFDLKNPKQKAKDESCKGKPTEETCPDPNTEVEKAAKEANDLIDKVVKTQLPPVNDGKFDFPATFSIIFRNNDSRNLSATVSEVKNNYLEIQKFIGGIKSHTRCGTDCDGGCRSGSPAYHSNAEGKHIITFCPGFAKDPKRILIMLHECHHGAISGSKDIAYAETRLIDKLDHSKALLNAASFHLYASLVENPLSDVIGHATKDSNSIADAGQKKNVDQALAFMEQWFRLVPFDMSVVAANMDDARTKGSYSPKARVDLINNSYVKWFQLTPAPRKPTETDVTKAKAIEERSVVMEKAFNNPFSIQDSKDISLWQRGPGTEIKLNKGLLNLDMTHLVIALLQQLVHATPNISADVESLYVGLINDIRNARALDP